MDDDRKPRISPPLFETTNLDSNNEDAKDCSKSNTSTTTTTTAAALAQPPPPPPPPQPPQQQQQHMLSHNTHSNYSHSRHNSDSENQDVKPSFASSSSSMPPSTVLAAAAAAAEATSIHTSRKVVVNSLSTSIHDASRLMYRRPLPCEGCREWRRKCDLTKPSCNRCIERGAVCMYNPLRYERKNARLRLSPSSSTSTTFAANESESPPPPPPQLSSQSGLVAATTTSLPLRKPDSVMAISNIIEPSEDANHPVVGTTSQQNASSNHGIGGLATITQRRHLDHTESTANRKQHQQHQQQQQQQALSKRGKACTFCHRRKTKCDMSKPACSDCANRGLECVYLN